METSVRLSDSPSEISKPKHGGDVVVLCLPWKSRGKFKRSSLDGAVFCWPIRDAEDDRFTAASCVL